MDLQGAAKDGDVFVHQGLGDGGGPLVGDRVETHKPAEYAS